MVLVLQVFPSKRQVLWSDRLIGWGKVRSPSPELTPANEEAHNGRELQQLLCATNWMPSSLPAYAETIAPQTSYSRQRTRRLVDLTRKPCARFISMAHGVQCMTLLSQQSKTISQRNETCPSENRTNRVTFHGRLRYISGSNTDSGSQRRTPEVCRRPEP